MATAKLYLDKRASVGLTAPVKVLITHNRKSVFLSLGVKVPIEKWDSQMLCLKGKENRNLQLFIMQKKVEIDEALINIIRRGIPSDMTATQLREMVLKEISPQIESEQLNAEEKKDCF
ncbi:MAG: Arm DNA-binding domain-containing protein, partial [Muribaculaceae bacterium]|nr:Arm DNA-binding domain-containing protein [Muribaculaceae bacterium]